MHSVLNATELHPRGETRNYIYKVKLYKVATCIERSITDYGTVHPSLTLFKLRSSFLSLANIYMEHYKEQLATYVFSSTVEPKDDIFCPTIQLNRKMIYFVQQYS